MMNRAAPVVALILVILGGSAVPAQAQVLETVGIRALGMGSAFVAVADDSAATWWNPAGLADGPFLDMAIARTSLNLAGEDRPGSDVATGFTLGTPPVGFSYYRLRITQIQAPGSTVPDEARREEGRAGTRDSLDVSQFGATLIQTLMPGIHAATTLKYVRGTAPLDGGTVSRFDLDAGLLAVAGPFRFGVVGRNLREPAFDGVRLPRQVRLGAAFDAEAIGGAPLIVSLDADARAYESGAGERRAVAAGVERWFRMRRIGVRGGVRVNTVGAREGTATAGASWLLRPGVYADGYLAGGDERGWGAAARISF